MSIFHKSAPNCKKMRGKGNKRRGLGDLLVVFSLVRAPNSLKDLGLELVLLLELFEEGHRFWEQVEGVDHHDLDLT